MNRYLRHSALVTLLLPALAFGQSGAGTLATPPGERGVWVPPNAGDERLVELDSANSAPANLFAIEANPLLRNPRIGETGFVDPSFRKLTVSEVPFQPWAKAVYAYRQENQLEPHTRCKPSGGPRQFLTPYGVEFVDMPELQRVFILDVGGPHTFRVIYLNGTHPKDLAPSYYGHSIGRWEGDTLIVDTVGFNERMWIDRGAAPHTEQLHLTEKFTRTDMNSMTYELTVDDPGAYTATWSRTSQMQFRSNSELFEFVCQDNNFASDLLVGTREFVDRTSVIVP